ncbi:uncharacterized protein JCM6883_006205 [Sporobolomyces salmoneus]|uniref:uncharacterized protein n=1 Tax=Sporobolomyces salmoneus TaxID=183962 RepID=UPI0031759246
MVPSVRVAVPPITVEPSCPPSPPSNLPPPPPEPSPLASFAAEMFVWLWFAPNTDTEEQEDQGEMKEDAGMRRMQFAPNARFVMFCHDVLTTTQVAHSVVILALLFVSRLKQRNSIKGSPGSEFRLAVTGLMLANKVLDDNTYTARTWSQVSSLELKPLVEGEAEFLKGLNWSLHVTEREFRSFLKLLEGHVAARNARVGRLPRKIASTSRVRRQMEKSGGGELGLGITAPGRHALDLLPQLRTEEDRNVRRRVEGVSEAGSGGGGGVTMSATSTPTMPFGSFSFPLGFPASAPHPHLQSQPLSAGPIYPGSLEARPTSSSNEISPTSSLPLRRSSGSGSKKRNLDDAMKSVGFPSLPHLLLPSNPTPAMSRSQSSSASFSSSTPVYTPPSGLPLAHPHSSPSPLPTPPTHGPHSSFPRPLQLANVEQIHQSFDTLADRFSPRYDPGQPLHRRLSSLDYYSLAAGQGQGRLHQVPPPQPPSLNFPHPYGFSTAPYPAPYHAPPPHCRPAGGSLASSPTYSSRQTNYVPSKPSVLSGLRSSPPSSESTSSRRTSQLPSHLFSHQLPHESTTQTQTQSRRSSNKVLSSPGLTPSFDEGTSTPRPSTGGSSVSVKGESFHPQHVQYGNRVPPLSAGLFNPWPHLPHPGQYHQQQHLWSMPMPGPWLAYANAGPPGVYWAAYPPPPPQ